MGGASALQELLTELPADELHVQVVWEPVLATDVGPPLDSVLARIHDPRAAQYWDAQRALSIDMVRSINSNPAGYGRDEPLPADFIAWDLVLVFGAEAHWDASLPRPHYYGGPVVDVIEETKKALAALHR